MSELLLASRVRFRPRLHLEENFPADILKIPPTPIAGFPGFETHDLLTAIASQFQLSSEFSDRILQEVQTLKGIALHMGGLFQSLLGSSKSKTWLDSIRDFQRKAIYRLFEDLPMGSAFHQRELDEAGRLGLEISAGHEKVRLNFSKSELPRHYNLTHNMTAGIGAAGLWSYFDGPEFICSALLDFIEVITPSTSRLNSYHPSSTSLGELLLTPILFNCITETCNLLMPKKAIAQMGSALLLDVQFEKGLQWFDRVLGGGGATGESPGLDGQAHWLHLPLFPSIEEIEKRYPLLVLRHEKRGGSGGRGSRPGGEGVRKTLEFTESAQITWAMEHCRMRPEGCLGGSSGDSSSASLTLENEEPRLLKGSGSIRVPKGSRLTLLAPGGGGHSREAT